MNSVDLNLLDEASSVAFMGMFSIFNRDNIVVMDEFDIKNEACLTLLHLSELLRAVAGVEIYINISFIDNIKLKLSQKIKYKRTKQKANLHCTEFIKKIEENFYEGVLNDIYINYYGRVK